MPMVKTVPTWGCLRSVLTLESIASTNAAVLPVPDCDWAIMFCGGSANSVGKAVSYIEAIQLIKTIAMKQEEHLDFGGGIESHCIDTLEQVGLQVELFETFHRVKRTIWVLALDLQIILVLHQALPDHLQKNL